MYQAPANGTGNNLGNAIIGNARDNTLRGEDGNDQLDGRGGADEMHGGRDDDTYVFDNAGDEAIEDQNEGTDTVYSSVDTTLANNVEKLFLVAFPDILGDGPGVGAHDGTGNNLANEIVGNFFANVLDGRRGSDTLTGGGRRRHVRVRAFGLFDNDFEQDVITDFQAGVDRIDVSDTPDMGGWNDLNNSSDGDFMEQVGNNVVIHTTTEDRITLLNVQMSSLTQADFLF